MPFVDGCVVLRTGVCTTPGGVRNLVPHFAGRDTPHDPAVAAGGQFPVFVFLQAAEEFVGDADGVIGVLSDTVL